LILSWQTGERGARVDFDRDRFYRKLEKEIARLQETANRLEGLDKQQVVDMIHALQLECGRFREYETSREAIESGEKDQSLASIIEILNTIEGTVQDLETALIKKEPRVISSTEEAQRIVHQFFYDCQVAEEQIKSSAEKGHITTKQRADLQTQLRGLVHRMILLSRQSKYLVDAVLQSYEARMFS